MTDDDLKSLALDFHDQMVGIDLLRAVFQAGAASRDAEIYGAIDMLNEWNDELLAQIKQKDADIAELQKAIDENWVTHQQIVAASKERDQLRDEVAELVGVLGNVTAHLVAAHSLLSRGGKKAAASDTVFKIMLQDYEKSFEAGRKALAKVRKP